ncbi:MAG: hypothetical protein ABI663_03455 [Chryseolinea sp.]
MLSVITKGKENPTLENDLGVDGNSEGVELKAFMKAVVADFDEDRVYVSDIKKLIKWYGVISKYAPEILGATV